MKVLNLTKELNSFDTPQSMRFKRFKIKCISGYGSISYVINNTREHKHVSEGQIFESEVVASSFNVTTETESSFEYEVYH